MAGTASSHGNKGIGSTPRPKLITWYGIVLNLLKVWGSCLAISACVFGIFSQLVINNRSATISHPDMVDVKSTLGGYQTFLCKGIHISTLHDSFKAYRLDHTAKIYNIAKDRINMQDVVYMNNSVYKRSFFVLEGSELTGNFCINGYLSKWKESLIMKVLIFQGQESFDDWNKVKQSEGGAIQSHNISSNYDCAKNTSYQINVKALSTDNYFFVYIKPSSELVVLGNLVYDLILVRYDVRSASVVCASVTSCYVPFDLNSDGNVVLQFEPGADGIFYQSSCSYRIEICLLMFLVIPSGIALIGSGFVLWCELKSVKQPKMNKTCVIGPQTTGKYIKLDKNKIKTKYSERNQIC